MDSYETCRLNNNAFKLGQSFFVDLDNPDKKSLIHILEQFLGQMMSLLRYRYSLVNTYIRIMNCSFCFVWRIPSF